MILRLGYSWRLRCERMIWFSHPGFGFRGHWPGFRFVRYESVDWRQWYIKLGTWRLVAERPSSDLDGERLEALLKARS